MESAELKLNMDSTVSSDGYINNISRGIPYVCISAYFLPSSGGSFLNTKIRFEI